MRTNAFRLWNIRFIAVLAIGCFLGSANQARAQLWEVPPLPPVKEARATDGMTATVGSESLHFSVCRSSVIPCGSHARTARCPQREPSMGARFEGVVPGREVRVVTH